MEAVSAELTLSQKFDILWQAKKPLVIGVIALIIILLLAIILAVVFLVIKPFGKPEEEHVEATKNTAAAGVKVAKHIYTHLRNRL